MKTNIEDVKRELNERCTSLSSIVTSRYGYRDGYYQQEKINISDILNKINSYSARDIHDPEDNLKVDIFKSVLYRDKKKGNRKIKKPVIKGVFSITDGDSYDVPDGDHLAKVSEHAQGRIVVKDVSNRNKVITDFSFNMSFIHLADVVDAIRDFMPIGEEELSGEVNNG